MIQITFSMGGRCSIQTNKIMHKEEIKSIIQRILAEHNIDGNIQVHTIYMKGADDV